MDLEDSVLVEPRILFHRKVGDKYRLEMLVAHQEGSVDQPTDIVRVFEWGEVPVATEQTPRDAYSDIHDRELVPGEPMVTEDEYVYLQVCEAFETVATELNPRESEPLLGERIGN